VTRSKRKASGFDETHAFWPKALDLWRRGYSNAQVANEAQSQGFEFNEDQVRYARKRYGTAAELPVRGAKWLRDAVRQVTEVYPSALEQQQALFANSYEVFLALKGRLLAYLNGSPPADELELAQLKVLLDAFARQGRLLNETNDTITVLQAKLGRLESSSAEPETSLDGENGSEEEVEPLWDA
jgi:hypothetical protein